ncbi:hypothetical protein Tco_0845044 [Tanacetum coccineum]
MNREVGRFNSLMNEMKDLSRENNEDWMTRVEIVYKSVAGTEFKHKSAWLFLKDKYKWKNPDSTNARRNRGRVDEEPEFFGDDELPRRPGKQRIAKSQRSTNSSASSGSNPTMFQDMLQKQYELDRAAKMERLDRETSTRVELINSQKVAEDLKVLQIYTRGMCKANEQQECPHHCNLKNGLFKVFCLRLERLDMSLSLLSKNGLLTVFGLLTTLVLEELKALVLQPDDFEDLPLQVLAFLTFNSGKSSSLLSSSSGKSSSLLSSSSGNS